MSDALLIAITEIAEFAGSAGDIARAALQQHWLDGHRTARRSDPETSKQAAKPASLDSKMMLTVLGVFYEAYLRGNGGLTDGQVLEIIRSYEPGTAEGSPRKRRFDLMDGYGFIQDSGIRVTNENGSMVTVYQLTPRGAIYARGVSRA